MPYILFNTHHWQRAASQESHEAASLHNISGYTHNHSSVSEGQHATRCSCWPQSYFCDAVWTETMIPSYAHTMSLSFLQTTKYRLLTLWNGHQSPVKHFWFQSLWFLKPCNALSLFYFFFEKTQWTKWILSLWEQAAAASTWLFTMLKLFLFLVSLLFSFSCPPRQSENFQLPSNTPVHAY